MKKRPGMAHFLKKLLKYIRIFLDNAENKHSSNSRKYFSLYDFAQLDNMYHRSIQYFCTYLGTILMYYTHVQYLSTMSTLYYTFSRLRRASKLFIGLFVMGQVVLAPKSSCLTSVWHDQLRSNFVSFVPRNFGFQTKFKRRKSQMKLTQKAFE